MKLVPKLKRIRTGVFIIYSDSKETGWNDRGSSNPLIAGERGTPMTTAPLKKLNET